MKSRAGIKDGLFAFIGGTGRCGSTMLLKVLKLHPELWCLRSETNPNPGDSEKLNRWLGEHVKPLRDDKGWQGYIVDKTPANVWYADLLLHYLPHSRYIHLTRNRERYIQSVLRHKTYPFPGWGHVLDADEAGEVWDLVWTRGFNIARKWGAERVMLLDFEDVVTEPHATLREVCAWLGVSEPNEEMVGYPFDRSKA